MIFFITSRKQINGQTDERRKKKKKICATTLVVVKVAVDGTRWQSNKAGRRNASGSKNDDDSANSNTS